MRYGHNKRCNKHVLYANGKRGNEYMPHLWKEVACYNVE
jgi:hypothetical protein